jgi:hypothetical protein
MEKNNLENKIKIIFDYLYNETNKNCFTIEQIILGQISLDDIKLPLPNDDEEQEYYNKNKLDILNAKLSLIDFDENTYQVLFKRYSIESVNIKVNFYDIDNKIDSFNSPVNNDSLFSYLLSSLVINHKTKHILLPIINLDIKFSDIEENIINNTYKTKIKSGITNNKISNICCLQLREHFFKTINLQEYIKENTCSYKMVLFQVIHTLAVIEREFNNFRHNNLILKNILVYIKNKSDQYTEYEFNEKKYFIMNVDIDIKITNFEKAVIPKFYGKENENKNSDIYTFVSELKLNDKKNVCNKETIEFINSIKKNTNVIELLDSNYFNEYLKKKLENNDEPKEENNSDQHAGYFNVFMDSDNYSELGNQKLLSKSNIIMHRRTLISNDKNKSSKNIIRKNIKNQNGGSKPELAPYKGIKNNPYLSNEERKINEKRSFENPIKEPPIILEQKVYDLSQQTQQKPQYPPSFIPLYADEGEVANRLLPYSKVINQPPIQKVYNVSLTNPLVGQTSLNRIFEDSLPGDPRDFTFKTVFERKQLIDFMRNSIIDNCDGEDMTVVGGKNSLLSYIKMMEINPYGANINSYKNLARNFILYRAGYPIRLDEKTMAHIGLAKGSMGVNVRMYMLSHGDLRCKTINNLINAENFDVWRDIKYYDWIRDDIIKRKVSPNFICPILYKIDTQSKIDWKQLDMVKSKEMFINDMNKLKDNQSIINNKHNLEKTRILQKFLPMNSKNNQTNKEDLTINSGKTLILLTEAPTSSFCQWSSMLYKSSGTLKKMISTGYHTPEVWKSILFQLVYACAILQIKKVYINKLSLENNFYIKDIFSDPNSIGSWIYKVNNIEYYIPNYGYILLIDSIFTDVDPSTITNDDQKYKIYGNIYSDNAKFKIDTIDELIFNQFKEIINPDNFGHEFKLKGGSIPDDSVIDLLKNMYNDTSSKTIKDFIIKYFNEFLHNRIGTLLYKSEKENINLLSKPNFNKGNIMIYKRRYEEYEWIIFVDDDKTNYLKKNIISKKDNKYNQESVFSASLFGYPEMILPETQGNMKYNESYIYETYNLNSLEK